MSRRRTRPSCSRLFTATGTREERAVGADNLIRIRSLGGHWVTGGLGVFSLAAVIPYSSGIQQPKHAATVLSRYPPMRWPVPLTTSRTVLVATDQMASVARWIDVYV